MKKSIVVLVLIHLAYSQGATAQCRGFVTEETPPPAVLDMATTDPGFVVRFWSWGSYPDRRGGAAARLLDFDGGIVMMDLDWGEAEICRTPGLIDRTAFLFESLGPDGFGRYALVNVGRVDGGVGADIDDVQYDLGNISSRAAAIPEPAVDHMVVTGDSIEFDLSWAIDAGAEALSDLSTDDGEPLPSLRGWAVYIINGPQPTARPWDWSFARDLEDDAVDGFSTDASAHLILPRSLWHDVSICLALAPTFDCNGSATGEGSEACSVHSTYLGHPTTWIALPPETADSPFEVVFKEVRRIERATFEMVFFSRFEPDGARYRILLRNRDGRELIVDRFAGGAGSYRRIVDLHPWAEGKSWELILEARDRWNHVVLSERIPRRLRR